ncbi:MAG: hypothetical protein HYU83_05800 [Chloroflexi bacterium]|nr:hypothetical protein [Chloroflexota bacterium]
MDLFVFGRRAGKAAAQYAKKAKTGSLTLDHVRQWQKQLAKLGLTESRPKSPMLLPNYSRQPDNFLPDYTREILGIKDR